MGNYKVLFGCFIFVLLWSSGWIGSKYGQEYAGTFTLLAYRYVVVVLILLAFVTFTRSWRRMPSSQFALHVCVGILSHAVYLGTGNSALLLGVSAGLVAFITALQPMITATMSSRIAGESASYRQWAGLALGFAAILLVISDKIALGGSLFAYSLPFIAILAISLASLIDRRVSLQNQSAKLEPTPLSLVSLIHCTSALLVMLPAAAVLEGFEATWGSELIFSILWLAVIVSLGAYGMMFFMLRKISAIKVASLEYLAPPTTMIIAYFMFGETLSVVDMVGIFVAGIAVWLVVSATGERKSESTIANDIDPSLRQSTRAAFSLVSDTGNPSDLFSGKAPDIDLSEEPLSAHTGLIDKNPRVTEEMQMQLYRNIELEKLLVEKNREISRLYLVWDKFKESQAEIQKLNRALSDARNENAARRLGEIEMGYLCENLQDIVSRQR